MSADLIGDDACREAFNKARQQRFSVHGLDVVCEPDIFRAGYAAGRDSEIAKRDARMAELEKELQAGATAVENCELFRAELAAIKAQEPVSYTYASKQETQCAGCGIRKHTPLRVDEMGGYVCLTCIDKKLEDFYAAPVPEAKAQGVVMPTVDQAMRVVLRGMGSSKHIRGTSNWCADVGRAVLDEVARLNAAHVQHPDDDAVDCFAVAMKVKLAASREKGRHGWQNATGPHLSSLIHEHMFKGDPLDVGNLAMMLHQNGQAIELPHDARRVTPPVQQVSVPASRDTLTLAYRLITSELKTLANGSAIDRYKAAQCELRALIAVAPAAPAADAGLVEALEKIVATAFNWRESGARAMGNIAVDALAAHRAKGAV